MDTSFVKNLSYKELQKLLSVVQVELGLKNPESIELVRKANEYWKQQEQKAKEKENACDLAVEALWKLSPGTLLKMRGCKDGTGLREFIRWDKDGFLVCWQIKLRRVNGARGQAPTFDFYNTNIVTTHMADKVAGVYSSDRKTLTKIKDILAGKSLPT